MRTRNCSTGRGWRVAFLSQFFEYKKPGREQSERTRPFLPRGAERGRVLLWLLDGIKKNITFLANLNIC